MPAKSCDYYKPVNARSRIVCPNCWHWNNNKCSIERLVKVNGKTDLVHEPVRR
jgi:hypothetical protein